jgi:hypothetical protein
MMRIKGLSCTGRQSGGRKLAGILAGVLMVLGSVGCNPGDEEATLATITTSLPNSTFTATASADCPRADLLSMQKANISGSGIQIDLVLTDCDSSMTVSGVSFEITFDPSVMNFIGCSPGTLFPQTDLAPGLPVCSTIGGGRVLGSIALAQPVGVTVPAAPGNATVIRLTFNMTKKGVSAPAAFLPSGLDTLSSTSVFLVDPSSASITVHILGAGGYAGGTFISK